MGIIAKQGSWNFVIIYLGVILGTVNNLFLMPNAMSTAELGIITVLLSLTLIGSQIALFGAPLTIMKFYPRHKDSSAEFGLINFILRNMTISLIISVSLYLLLKSQIIEAYESSSSLFGEYYYMYIPLLSLFVFQEFFGGYLRSLLKTVYFSLVKEVILRVYQSVLYLLLLIGLLQFDVFLVCYVCGYLMTTVLNVVQVKKTSGFKLFQRIGDRKEKISILKYSTAVFSTGIAGALLSNIDVIMIGAIAPMMLGFDGMELAGIYGRMAFMAILILIPLRSVLGIAIPMISKAWEENDHKELKSIYKKSSLTLTILGLLTFVGVWVNIDNVFRILPDGFEIGKYAFLFLALANLLQTGLGVNGPIISNSPYYWLNGIAVPVLAGLVIVTNLIFIPEFGIEGAAMATAGSRFIFSVIVYFFLFIKYKMQPLSWRNFYGLGVALATIFLVAFIPTIESLVLDILVRSLAVLVLFLPAIILPRISPEINEMMTGVFARVGIRKN